VHPTAGRVLSETRTPENLPSNRHTYATPLLARGTHPTYVQKSLGHASVQLTLERYSHWMPSMGRNAADGIDEALGSAIYSGPSVVLSEGSGRNHKETWAGCIVSPTTAFRSPLKVSRSVASLSFAEKASSVFEASYFLL
jgi:hypothetical protein